MDRDPPSGHRLLVNLIVAAIVVSVVVLVLILMMGGIHIGGGISHQVLTCKNNLKNIGTAIKSYESQHGALPPMLENKPVPDGGESTQVTLFYQLLPYLEMEELVSKSYAEAAATKIPLYNCPVDSASGTGPGKAAYSSYAANYSIFRGRMDPTKELNLRITSVKAMPASSSTIIVGERLQNCNGTVTAWSIPGPSSYFHVVYTDKETGLPNQPAPFGMHIKTGVSSSKCRPYTTEENGPDDPGSPENPPSGTTFQSAHSGVMNVLRGDGQVSQISSNFDPVSLNFYCVGTGRSTWEGTGTKYATFP